RGPCDGSARRADAGELRPDRRSVAPASRRSSYGASPGAAPRSRDEGRAVPPWRALLRTGGRADGRVHAGADVGLVGVAAIDARARGAHALAVSHRLTIVEPFLYPAPTA